MIHEQLIQRVCRHLNILEGTCPRAVGTRLPLSRKMCHGGLLLGLEVLLDYFKVHARLRPDLVEGDLKVFVYIAMGHGRTVGHLGHSVALYEAGSQCVQCSVCKCGSYISHRESESGRMLPNTCMSCSSTERLSRILPFTDVCVLCGPSSAHSIPILPALILTFLSSYQPDMTKAHQAIYSRLFAHFLWWAHFEATVPIKLRLSLLQRPCSNCGFQIEGIKGTVRHVWQIGFLL